MYTAGSTQANSGPRILVVRLGAMGDVLHALPAVATLKHGFPNSRLSWVIAPKWAPLIEGNPFVDEAILFERKTFSGLVSAWRELRHRRFDLAVDFQGLVKSAIVASVARPDRIYGFHQSLLRERVAALFYSNRVLAQAPHVVDRNLELASAAGASSIVSAFPVPDGTTEGELPEGGFVLANPLAGWPGKQWPLDYYSTLAGLLRRDLDLPLVLNGPPQAAGTLAQVAGPVVHLSGISGLIHATRRALAVIGIDSGPMHLAAALQKPGVAIFGPTDPSRNGPYGSSFTVLRDPAATTSYKRKKEPHPAMGRISPDDVLAALRERLSVSQCQAGSAR
ncbi:MAG TPA: glycosyltransferase family 9 protein [Bryobacteraceae bacterium]|nr:glycosyltransferase family 9 protein [Bryobacteraceae bacterium]